MASKYSERQSVIRVFISSTFRDMQAERDELVKYTFPKLSSLCESRGVIWGEVDLRWGITDEEKAEGKVLPLCLEEIKNCRPYFIGILGERYGWMPDEISEDLITREPWLKEHLNCSVTELEILHGVLKNPDMAEHAFFYFRAPTYIETLPSEEKNNFTVENPEGAENLLKLKESIRKSGFPVRENYPTPKALGELVLKDMTDVINRLFPEGSAPDPLDSEASDHEQFARSRAGVFIGRQEYFQRLDEHAKSSDQPMVILGESGSGKSALLSTWALQYKESHPDELLIMHFIGSNPYSVDWMAMLRRIMGEIKRHYNISYEIPNKPDELRTSFANLLHMASARGKAVIILDALNQIEDKDAALDLVWIPPFIPENIRMIVSTLPGKPLEEIEQRGWKSLKVEPLTKDERIELIIKYLLQYSKKLNEEQTETLAKAPQTANPLYLRALLEELKLYGDHFTIKEQIRHYLTASSIDDLYEQILERYEQDYERDMPGLVKDAMSLIWSARRGLTETELTELLGTDGMPLPHAYWTPLYLAAKTSLISKSGLMSFNHEYFRKAVMDRYLPTAEDRETSHVRLADYFEKQELNNRKVDELPWHFLQARRWRKLFNTISLFDFMNIMWKSNRFEFISYMNEVENNSSFRFKDEIRVMVEDIEKKKDMDYDDLREWYWNIAEYLNYREDYVEELTLLKHFAAYYQENFDSENLADVLNRIGNIFSDIGDYQSAIVMYKESEKISYLPHEAMTSYMKTTSPILIRNENISFIKKIIAKILLPIYFWSAKKIGRIADPMILADSFESQGLTFMHKDDLDNAMQLFRIQEKLSHSFFYGNINRLRHLFRGSSHLVNLFYKITRNHQKIKEMKEGFQEWDKGMVFKYGFKVAKPFKNQALVLKTQGQLDNALKLLKKMEIICRQLADMKNLCISLNSQAEILRLKKDFNNALPIHKEAKYVYRKLGDIDGLQNTLGNEALTFELIGDLNSSLKLLKEREAICRTIGKKVELKDTLLQIIKIMKSKGELANIEELEDEADKIDLSLHKESKSYHLSNNEFPYGIKCMIEASLDKQIEVFKTQGDAEGAKNLLNKKKTSLRKIEKLVQQLRYKTLSRYTKIYSLRFSLLCGVILPVMFILAGGTTRLLNINDNVVKLIYVILTLSYQGVFAYFVVKRNFYFFRSILTVLGIFITVIMTLAIIKGKLALTLVGGIPIMATAFFIITYLFVWIFRKVNIGTDMSI